MNASSDRIRWRADDAGFELAGHHFDIGDAPCTSPELFWFRKNRWLVQQYLDFFDGVASGSIEGVVELGMLAGGSVPFWCELFDSQRHIGVDLAPDPGSALLQRYIERRGAGRVELHWRTSQSDAPRLREICDKAFGTDAIDLVIDDCSHYYEETRSSFETLFPRIRPGGYYIIEDWAWSHWRGIESQWAGRRPLTDLVVELTEVCGTGGNLLRSIYTCSGFTAIQRGKHLPSRDDFHLDTYRYSHPR